MTQPDIAETVHFVSLLHPGFGCQAAIVTRQQPEQGADTAKLTVFNADNTGVSDVSGIPYDAAMSPGTWHNLADHV